MKLSFIGSARQDLRKIARYHECGYGRSVALQVVQEIKRDIMSLVVRLAEVPPYEPVPGVHCDIIVEGAYLLFYRINATVEILRIQRKH